MMRYSAAHKLIVYGAAEAERAATFVPGARPVNGRFTAFPATHGTTIMLREAGLPVPSLIDLGYDWPIKPPFKPMAHQRAMAAFMSLHPRCCNLADPGTGKTLAALWAADYLMTAGLVRSALVLAPLSTLQQVWQSEIFTHLMGRRTSSTLYGTAAQRMAALGKRADFYLINHDGLAVGATRKGYKVILGPLAETLRCRQDIDLVIVDEASAFRDAGTRRSRILRQVSADKRWLWLMTGTPVSNDPTDAWGLRKLLDPHWPMSQQSFRNLTMTRVSNFKYLPNVNAKRIVEQTLQPAIRFSRDECLDLPPCTVITRKIEPSPAQVKAYAELKKLTMLRLENGGEITTAHEGALRMKLIQVACGAIYDADHNVHPIDARPRLDALRDLIAETDAKIIVFAPLTSVVTLLYKELSTNFSVAMVTGQVTSRERDEIFADFRHKADPRILVADPGTMAHGLTLTEADTTIWYGPTDRAEVYEQANARFYRAGQTKKVRVIRLVGSPVEAEIYRRLEEKTTLQGSILTLVQQSRG